MNRFLVLFLLFASSAAAQGIRFSSTVTQQGTVGTSTNVVVLPASPIVKFCLHPANAVPCTNLATTYTDQTLATPCAGATQIVRDGTTTCVASPDAQNNWGVWVAPNTLGYDYTITLPGGVNLGPFNVLSQTMTFSGTVTFTGALLCSNLDSIRCVNSSTAGADLGAKVNTADASLGTSPGEIWIDSSAGTTWTTATTFSGPRKIVFLNGTYTIPMGNLVLSQPVRFDCQTKYQTLTFTGSGTAFLFKQATLNGAYTDWGAGVENCTIYGPGGFAGGGGNSGTGLQIGDATHASVGVYWKNNTLSGFTIGITWGNATAWGFKSDHSVFINNTQDLLYNLSGASGMENVRFDHTVFGTFTPSAGTNANDVQISGTAPIDIGFTDCSFDSGQFNISNSLAVVIFNNLHSENPNGNSTTIPFLMSAGRVLMLNPQFYQDFPSGSVPSTFISQSGGFLNIVGPYYSTNTAMIQAVTNSGSATTFQFGTIGVSGTFSSGYFNPTVNPYINIGDPNGGSTFGGNTPVNIFNQPLNIGGGNNIQLGEGGAASGSVGNDRMFGDSTTHTPSWNNNNNGLSSPSGAWQCTNVTGVTLPGTSTTADQNLMACTIPAGTLNRVGRTLRVKVKGVYSTPAASTSQITLKIKLCTVSGCGSGTVISPINIQSTALGTVQITNDNFSLRSEITTQTAGASSAYEASGEFLIDLSTLATAADSDFGDTNTATVGTIDSTAQLFLQTTIAFSSASASNVATQRQLIAETIN